MKRRATRTRRRLLRSLPFIPNRGLEIEYAKELRGLVLPMVKDVRAQIMKLYRRYASTLAVDGKASVTLDAMGDELQTLLDDFSARYSMEFAQKGREAAVRMVRKQRENADATFAGRMESLMPSGAALAPGMETMGVAAEEKRIKGISPIVPMAAVVVVEALSPELQEVLSAAVIENESLIKTIPAKFLDRAAGATTRAMQAGATPKELNAALTKYGNMTLNHATRVALDQTFKTFTSINLRKFQKAGIKQFEWLHTGGSVHPREHHLTEAPAGLNHGIFDLDDPPVIDPRTGERGYPGQLPYCRCVMAAVIDLDMFG